MRSDKLELLKKGLEDVFNGLSAVEAADVYERALKVIADMETARDFRLALKKGRKARESYTLRQLRQSLKMTQSDVASSAKISLKSMYSAEQENAEIFAGTLDAFIAGMGGKIRLTAEFMDKPTVILNTPWFPRSTDAGCGKSARNENGNHDAAPALGFLFKGLLPQDQRDAEQQLGMLIATANEADGAYRALNDMAERPEEVPVLSLAELRAGLGMSRRTLMQRSFQDKRTMERVETNAVSDVLVSRLYTYIAELGGKLNITVILPDHTQIELTGLLQENTAARQKRLLAMRNMAAG